MVDHIGRKVWILLTFLAVSLIALWALGFRMGLDLQGGTRLVYSVDFEKALADGAITKEQFDNPDTTDGRADQGLARDGSTPRASRT